MDLEISMFNFKTIIEEIYSKYFIYQIICIKKNIKPQNLMQYFLLQFKNKIKNKEKYNNLLNLIFKFLKENLFNDINILIFYEFLFEEIPYIYLNLFLYIRNIIEKILCCDIFDFNEKSSINVSRIILIKTNIKIIDFYLNQIIPNKQFNFYNKLKEINDIFNKKETINYHIFIKYFIKFLPEMMKIKKNKIIKNNLNNNFNDSFFNIMKEVLKTENKNIFKFYEKYYFLIITNLKSKFKKEIQNDFNNREIDFNIDNIFENYKYLKNKNQIDKIKTF